MIIPMFSCGCLNSELWGARAESTRHAFCTRLGAVGHRCWPRPSRARDLARGARGKSIRCAGSAIAAGLHSPIRPHGPHAILQVAFTVVGHSPALALAPGSLAPHLAELCVLHLDRALVVVPIVVLLVLLVLAAGVAVAAALHARIALHVPDAGLQVALVVVGHGPTRALVAPAHTAQPLASLSVGVDDRALVVAAPVVVPVPSAPTVIRRSRAEASLRVRLSSRALLELRLVRKQGGPGATCWVVVVVAASPGAAPFRVLAVVAGEPIAIAPTVAAAPLDEPVLAARIRAPCRIVVLVTASPRAAPRLLLAVVTREPVAIAAPVAAVGIEMWVRLSSQALLDLRLVRKQGGPGTTCRVVVVVAT